jgi:hypothetical protein
MAPRKKTGVRKNAGKKPVIAQVLTDNGNLLKRKGRAKRK